MPVDCDAAFTANAGFDINRHRRASAGGDMTHSTGNSNKYPGMRQSLRALGERQRPAYFPDFPGIKEGEERFDLRNPWIQVIVRNPVELMGHQGAFTGIASWHKKSLPISSVVDGEVQLRRFLRKFEFR